MEETAHIDRERQEQTGSEQDANVADDKTRPKSDPVVDEAKHDAGLITKLETLVKEEEWIQQSDISC